MKFRPGSSDNRSNSGYDEQGVYVYEDGQRVAEAVLVRFEDNAYVKRHRSPFAAVPVEGGENDV